MKITPARKIAFEVLRRVETEGAYASDLLLSKLEGTASRADSALATELTLGVLRWQRLLDFIAARHLDRPSRKLDPEVAIALRIGLYQLRFLDRVPAHAAVNESVELVKAARKRSAVNLANAVLRKAAPDAKASDEALAKWLPQDATESERWGILHSHPTWMAERWLKRFSEERCLALLRWNNSAPAHVACGVIEPERIADVGTSIERDGMKTAPGRWLRSALLVSGGRLSTLVAFRNGEINIQDEGSQMIPLLLGATPGDKTLDLCAAPGGKTMTLARLAGDRGMVVAADRHPQRLRAMREQLKRTHFSNVRAVAVDGTEPLPFAPNTFPRILVDAPCSGTGTLAKNPEIRWRLKPEALATAHNAQVAMVRSALEALAPGGRLVYSTCSLEPEENEDVIREVLAGAPALTVVSAEPDLKPHLRPGSASRPLFAVGAPPLFRTFPPESQTDGFFAAAIEKPRG